MLFLKAKVGRGYQIFFFYRISQPERNTFVSTLFAAASMPLFDGGLACRASYVIGSHIPNDNVKVAELKMV